MVCEFDTCCSFRPALCVREWRNVFYPHIVIEKHGSLPGSHIQEQAADLEVVAVPFIDRRRELILETPITARKTGKVQPNVTLTLVGSIVYGHDESFIGRSGPGKGQKAIMSPVPLPRWGAFE
jgi:hypothetical protein